MTQMTSAMAAKELKKLNDQHDALTSRESKSAVFTAATQENVEDVRPAYDFGETLNELEAIEKKIRALKHSINTFNLTQEVPGFDMTIDQLLVYIPQLTASRRKLERMRDRLPKERCERSYASNIVEYDYANYDIRQAEKEYLRVTEELAKAQNALDKVNSTVTFEVDI